MRRSNPYFLRGGMDYDPMSGLYYSRERYYSPTLQRWMGKDPAGTVDGLNAYQNTLDNPEGNLDPMVLLTDPETIQRSARAILASAGPAPGHIFNLGHGLVPGTPPDNVAALVAAVHADSRAHRGDFFASPEKRA